MSAHHPSSSVISYSSRNAIATNTVEHSLAVEHPTQDPLTLARRHNSKLPVSSISDEIMSYIFLIGQNMRHWGDIDDNETPYFEVLVSHVNTYWRRVAINTQSLWRRINVVPGHGIGEIERYFARSYPCTTDIRIDCLGGKHWQAATMQIPASIIETVASNLSTCRRLTVVCESESKYIPLFARLKSDTFPMPHLEHLSLCINELEQPGSHSDAGGFRAHILPGGAPHLAFVRLRGLSAHFFRPPLTGVITLHIDFTKIVQFRYSRIRDMLMHSPQLRNLSMFGGITDPFRLHPPHIQPEPINLPNLCALRLCGTSTWVFDVVLAAISAPQLRSLVLKDIMENTLDMSWNTSLAGSSKFPLLDALEFHDFEFSEPTYQRAFAMFPAITTFTLVNYSPEEPIILSLLIAAARTQTEQPWPRMSVLTLMYSPGDEDLLEAAVEARLTATNSFRTIRLCTDDPTLAEEDIFESPLASRVEIFSGVGAWPVELGYADEDDFLFE